VKTALIRALRWLATASPHAGFALARALAWLSQPLGRGIPEERIATVFPELPPASLRAARRRTWSTFIRTEALDAGLERPGPAGVYPEILPNPALDHLRGPSIVAAFHVGPFPALGAVLERLPGEVLVLHRGSFAPRRSLTLVRSGETEWERARALHQAVTTLRDGGFVFTAMDGVGDNGYVSSTVEAPLLGGSVELARGGFALARITRTPIVLLFARWSGSSVEIFSADPIPPEQDESVMAAAAARRLEDYLREFPGEIAPRTLEILTLPPRR
jgi:hypothetical protein